MQGESVFLQAVIPLGGPRKSEAHEEWNEIANDQKRWLSVVKRCTDCWGPRS